MKKIVYFQTCKSLIDVKKRYKELALLHHPDRGGDTAKMQEINAEYAYVCENQIFFTDKDKETVFDFAEYADILNKIINFDVFIEICGSWLWITGGTYRYRAELKEYGFKFASKKVAWYWHAADYQKKSSKVLSLDQIRGLFGSQRIGTSPLLELA